MGDELVEKLGEDEPGQRRFVADLAQLQQQAVAQVARADAGRLETLDDGQHLLGFRHREVRYHLLVAPRGVRTVADLLVDPAQDFVEAAGEISIVVDVADEFIGQDGLPRTQAEERDLRSQVVLESAARDGDGFDPFAFVAVLPGSRYVEAVLEDLLPLGFLLARVAVGARGHRIERDVEGVVVRRRLLLALGVVGLLVVLFDEVEERVDFQLLLQVLLKVQQGHGEHVHRLVQARIDLHLLPHPDGLAHPGLHGPASSGPGTPSGCADGVS